VTFTNPHAKPYAFPAGKHGALSDYLTENTQLDSKTGCLEWVGRVNREGAPSVSAAITQRHGTRQATRLAWTAHHGRKLERGTQLVRTCGNPKCIHPLHLKEATAADLWSDQDLTVQRQGSVGALKLGKRTFSAQAVYQMQSISPPRDPHLGLRWAFYWDVCWPAPHSTPPSCRQRERLDIIRAVRRCPIRATRTVLPCGFIRYDLPPGVTEIAFTEPAPAEYTPSLLGGDEDGPDCAPEATWAIAA
jgi:hypothetical protein